MTSHAIALSTDGRERPRWQTAVFDAVGFVALIWAIPIAVVIIGAPIALVLMLVRAAIARL